MARRQKESSAQPTTNDFGSSPSIKSLDDDVARRAYELFEARGAEPGHDIDDWLRAEQELRAKSQGNPQGSPLPNEDHRAPMRMGNS